MEASMKIHSYLNDPLVNIIDTLDIALWELDTNYHVLNCNQKAYEIYGKRVVGDFCYHAAAGRDSICPNCPAQLVFAGHKSGRSEHTRITASGETIIIDHTATPLINKDGILVGVMGTIVDITHLKTTEQELKQHQYQLRDLVKKRTQESQESEVKYRRLYEKAKREEELYHSLLDHSGDAIVIYDMDGLVQYLNPTFTHMFGWSLIELKGQRVPFLPESEREKSIKYIMAAIYDNIPCQGFETTRLTKDGQLLNISLSASRYCDHQGQPVGMLVILRDITKRKQIEKALKINEERLQLALEGADLGTWDWDMQTNNIYFNPRYFSMLGYGPTELPYNLTTWENLLHPDEKESVKQQMMTSIKNGPGNWSIEFRLRAKDGQYRWILGRGKVVEYSSDNSPLRAAGTDLDITEIKNTERQLSQSEKKYRAMMKSMNDLVYICSPDYQVEYMNQVMIKRTGWDARGEKCFKAIHDFDEPCPWCKGKDEFLGKHFELDVVSPKDNHSYHVSLSPIINEDGSISSMIVFHDNTELKKLEEQLFQTQKMESIGNLAGGIAHDFNNILTVINSYAQIAMMNLEEGSKLWHNVREIEKAGDRAAGLTRQLLAFSRKQMILPKTIAINNVIANMKKMLGRLIGEDIRLETSLDEQISNIYADPSQLEQIVMNLVVNARDALKNQPEEAEKIIRISTAQVFLSKDYVADHSDSSPGLHMELWVEDSGCGMSEEVQKHIFEPFYTTKDVGDGTGMGLATVYGIVKQNKGIVSVYSEPGKGTTIKVYWPLMVAEAAESVAKVKPELARGGSETILLAEDDRQIREITSRQLCQAGYTIIEAKNGNDALKKAKNYQETIDLLFTDAVMPIMGGRELSEKIKEIYPEIPTLFTSGYMDDDIHQDILTLAKDRFINKPYNIQDIMDKIRYLLDNKAS
jgi:PAS domain S-box-containing protein